MKDLIQKICSLNGIDVTKPFLAHWVCISDETNSIEEYGSVYGDDVECEDWTDLAKKISADECPAGYTVEFQTYQEDENGETIDETIIDWVIDWVEGCPRLLCVTTCG